MQKRIIIDAMGGDNAPLEILKGTYLAQKEYGIAPVLVGNDKEIQKCIKDNNIALENVKIVNSNSVITMHDDAKAVLKEKADSSMGIGFKFLNEGEGDAFVSAGNTGCVTVGSTLSLKELKVLKDLQSPLLCQVQKSRFFLWTVVQMPSAELNFYISLAKWEAFICKKL